MNMTNLLVLNGSPVRNGATAEIVKIIAENASNEYNTKTICIDDYEINFCRGCKDCHKTQNCVINDGVQVIIEEMKLADKIVIVAPSYWADIPGQLKSFIDRCTPFCNTHEPHDTIGKGKKGFVVALRTGMNTAECNRIIANIEHYYGHMEIEMCGGFYLCGISDKADIAKSISPLTDFVKKTILNKDGE